MLCLRRRGQLRRRGLEKLVQRLDRLRTAAILDVVDEAHERVDGRRRNTLLTRKRADSADLRVDLSLALAHLKIAPHAGMRLRVRAVEGLHGADRVDRDGADECRNCRAPGTGYGGALAPRSAGHLAARYPGWFRVSGGRSE